MYQQIVLLFSVFFLSSSLIAQDFYQYKLSNYPIATSNCQIDADKLGQKLADETGVSVYQSYCKQETHWNTYELVVTYRAKDELPLVSTYSRRYFSSQASYASFDECKLATGAELKQFSSATGLQPFIHYCLDESSKSHNAFIFRIDAFGKPQQRPFVFNGSLPFGSVLGDATATAAHISSALKARQVDVATVLITTPASISTLVVHYYSQREINLMAKSHARYPTNSACLQQLREVNTLLKNAPNPPLGTVCTSSDMPWKTDLHIISVGNLGWTLFEPLDRYRTLEGCLNDRPHAISFYREELERNVQGAICSFRDGLYHYLFFEDPRRP